MGNAMSRPMFLLGKVDYCRLSSIWQFYVHWKRRMSRERGQGLYMSARLMRSPQTGASVIHNLAALHAKLERFFFATLECSYSCLV